MGVNSWRTTVLASLNGATRIHVTIGDPIAQVKSPAGVTHGFAARGADAIMIPLQVKPADIEEFFRLAKKLPNLDGIIITVPHKPVAFRHCDETSERSRVLEVANVMRRGVDNRWSGDMTDGGGFTAALRRNGFDPKGKRALQVGAGGAGSAIALSLSMEGARVTLADLDTRNEHVDRDYEHREHQHAGEHACDVEHALGLLDDVAEPRRRAEIFADHRADHREAH